MKEGLLFEQMNGFVSFHINLFWSLDSIFSKLNMFKLSYSDDLVALYDISAHPLGCGINGKDSDGFGK